jgi:hypothetical protein
MFKVPVSSKDALSNRRLQLIISSYLQVRGTMGHIAPEYLSTGRSSEKTDVFGYGILLLELITGQRAIDYFRLEEEDDVLLLDHVSLFCT